MKNFLNRFAPIFLLLTLLWTNPALNEDGTICTDLALLRFRVTQAVTGITYIIDYPIWALDDGFPDDGSPDTVWRSHPGLPDSARFVLPHSSEPYDWWRITVFAVDFSGNESDSSNTISVNSNDY